MTDLLILVTESESQKMSKLNNFEFRCTFSFMLPQCEYYLISDLWKN